MRNKKNSFLNSLYLSSWKNVLKDLLKYFEGIDEGNKNKYFYLCKILVLLNIFTINIDKFQNFRSIAIFFVILQARIWWRYIILIKNI